MKFLVLTLLLVGGLLPLNAQAAQLPSVQNSDGSFDIDIGNECIGKNRCDIAFRGIRVTLTGASLGRTYSSPTGLAGTQIYGNSDTYKCMSGPKITSNIPISGVRLVSTYYGNYPETDSYMPRNFDGTTFSGIAKGFRSSRDFMFPKPTKNIEFAADTYLPCVISLRFNMGNTAESFTSGLKASSFAIYNLYTGAQQNLEIFRKNIAASHRRHLERFSKALADGVASIGLTKEEPKVAITHRDVVESARMVVVMGTVLDELLKDYQDVEALQLPVENLRATVNALRDSYGFGNSLAGKPSAALGSLAALIRLELREIMILLSAMNDQGANQAVSRVMKKTQAIQAKAVGSDGGDAACRPLVEDLAREWNSAEFQTVLLQVMNGGADFDNLIQGKLKILFMAGESLSDLTGISFQVPVDSKTSTVAVKANKG